MKFKYLIVILLGLVACSPTNDLTGDVNPLGDFRLGHIVARTNTEMTKGPLSRHATNEEWAGALDVAFKNRFSRFSGTEIYHVGVTAEAYILAVPGIPVVAAPKSVLIFNVVVIENATQAILTPKAHQMTIIESLSGGSIIGSGYTQSKEEQLANLSEQAARATEKWLRTQPWFRDDKTGVIGVTEAAKSQE
ncbi:MAG: hypothetical protein ACPGRD_00255 [Planktomarina sp.]